MVKKKIIIPIFILFFIFSISTIFAADIGSVSGDSIYVEIGSDGGDNYVKPSDCPEGYVMQNITLTGAECIPIFNLTNVTLNTDLNDTQFEYIDDKLNLKTSWLTLFLDGLYCKLTGCNMSGDINMNSNSISNIDDLNGTGTLTWDGNAFFTEGSSFMRDINDETHHLNTDLENLDRLYSNVFLTPLILETFYNATGYYINISANTGDSITVNLGGGNYANNYRLPYNNIILELYNGSEITPVLNRVYVYLDGGTPTWEVSLTEPVVSHAMAARVLVGDIDADPYAASLQEDGQRGFLKRVQRRFRKEGLLYESGLDYNATDTYISTSEGNYINGIYDSTINGILNSSDGFYTLDYDGSYHWFNSFDEITEYSDGNLIGNNKYFNVVFGITPFDGTGNIYAVIQQKPPTEYTSVSLAYADSDNKLVVYPSDSFLRTYFLPVSRMIIKKGNTAQLLPDGNYGIDYRGGVAGGVSSGGGLSEVDPVWSVEKADYVPYTGATTNIDMNQKNITNIKKTSYLNDSYGVWSNTTDIVFGYVEGLP